MSKRMEMKTEAVEVSNADLVAVLEELGDVGTRGNGVVERIRKIARDTVEIKGEISLGYLNRVVDKMEKREVDYSVIRYAVLKMDDLEVYKKGRVNWLRKK